MAFEEDYVNPTMNVSAGVAAYNLPNGSYYDDLFIGRYVSKKPITVTHNDGGTVIVNGETVTSGTVKDFDVTNGISLVVTPNSGYAVNKVTVNGQSVIPDASGNVILSNVTGAIEISASFADTTVTAPQVTTNPLHNWFRMSESKPSIFVYGKLNDYYNPDLDAEYGFKIWAQSDPEHPLMLPSYDIETDQPAKAAPGEAFVIKIYGSAITGDNNYVVQPYVGDVLGDEIIMSYEE